MKNKFLYILALASTITFTSCDDFLDVDSPSAFDAEYNFSNTSDAYKMLLGAYACFAEDYYTSRMSNVFLQNNDIEIASVSSSQINNNDRRGIWCYNPDASFGDIYKAWNGAYLAIDRCNQCIEGIEASSLYKSGDKEMTQLLGEAYALRAYWYHILCCFWGDVPLAETASKSGIDLNTPRVDKNIIYSRNIQKLVDTEAGMKWASDINGGIERMNRDFALGLISRLSLFRAGYGMTKEGTMKHADDYLDVQNNDSLAVTYTVNGETKTARTSSDYYELAKVYAQKLIANRKYKMNTDFHQIFKNECQWVKTVNEDVMYEVAFVKNSGGDVAWCIGLSVVGGSYGAGTSYTQLSAPYVLSFDQDDQRYGATVANYIYHTDKKQKPVKANASVPAKWCRLWLPENPGASSSKSTGINWPIMRYSDVLLMLAEAENELNGPTDLAKDALKQVRERAFINSSKKTEKVDNYVNALADKTSFFEAIVNERAWEFGGEMMRKWDLVRWNKFGEKVLQMIAMQDKMGRESNLINSTGDEDKSLSPSNEYADVVYYTMKNGEVVFVNDPHVYMSEEEAMAKVGATATPATLSDDDFTAMEDNYTSPAGVLYKIDFAKACWASSTDKVTNLKSYYPGDLIQWSFYGYTKETSSTSDNWKSMTGKEPFPYLLPISTTTTGASKGVLDNNGWLLNNK